MCSRRGGFLALLIELLLLTLTLAPTPTPTPTLTLTLALTLSSFLSFSFSRYSSLSDSLRVAFSACSLAFFFASFVG